MGCLQPAFPRGLGLLAAVLSGMVPAWAFAGSVMLSSATMLTLGGAQHDVTLAIDPAQAQVLRRIAQGQPGSLPGDPASYRSATLVLEDVSVTAAGARGGYFYRIYLASPAAASAGAQQLPESLGPFEIAAARQRGTASLRYALGTSLAAWGAQAAPALVVSFRRAGGTGASGGDEPLIRIGSMRLELSTEQLN